MLFTRFQFCSLSSASLQKYSFDLSLTPFWPKPQHWALKVDKGGVSWNQGFSDGLVLQGFKRRWGKIHLVLILGNRFREYKNYQRGFSNIIDLYLHPLPPARILIPPGLPLWWRVGYQCSELVFESRICRRCGCLPRCDSFHGWGQFTSVPYACLLLGMIRASWYQLPLSLQKRAPPTP